MMAKRAFLCTGLVLITASFALAGPSLLVQTSVPWGGGGTSPATVMDNLAITYDQIPHSSFPAQSLAGYDFILLQGSDGEDEKYNQYVVPNMDKVSDYVNEGGLAIIHYADYVGGDYTIAPSGVKRNYAPDDQGNIMPGFEDDPLFDNVTDASLDNWLYTSQGYLTDLPIDADVLITNSIGEPIYARYTVGSGQVWITTMPLEYIGADPDVLVNELGLADQYIIIPAPGAVLLAGIGAGLAGLLTKQKKTTCRKGSSNING